MNSLFTNPLSTIVPDSFELVQRKLEMDVGHYILDDVKYPSSQLNEDPVLLSYALSWCNAKTLITLRRPICDLVTHSIGGDQKALLTGDRLVSSTTEAIVALYDTWLDLLSGVQLNAERIPDLTNQRDMWIGYLDTKIGTQLDSAELAQIVMVLHAFRSDLVPAAISETIQSPEVADTFGPAIKSTNRITI